MTIKSSNIAEDNANGLGFIFVSDSVAFTTSIILYSRAMVLKQVSS